MRHPIPSLPFKASALIFMAGMLAVSCAQADAPEPVAPATLFGNVLVKADGSRVGAEAVADKDIVAIYFSAQWCPPCRTFTPVLVKAANEMREAGKSFELVFVSSDRSENDMMTYMTEYKMPWVAVPHGSPVAKALSQRYGVRGIPMLVIIDRGGNTITPNARGDVTVKGAGAYDVWVAASPALKP